MKIRIFFTVFILSLLSSIKGEDYKSFISNLNLNLEEINVVTEDRYIYLFGNWPQKIKIIEMENQ